MVPTMRNKAGINTVQSADILKRQMNPSTTLLTSKFLALIKEGHWEYVDRVNATGAALIMAVTAEGKILLVEQYRIPVHAATIERPAGISEDEPGRGTESHPERSRRELLEET